MKCKIKGSDSSTENEKKAHSLMYSLLYPAALGTMIVGVVLGVAEGKIKIEYEFYCAIFLVFYFSSQHVENVRSENSYKASMFWLDVVEVGLILWLFVLLNIYEYRGSVIHDPSNSWKYYYWGLIAVFVIPVVSRWWNNGCRCMRASGLSQTIHSIIAVVVTLLSLLVEYSNLLDNAKYVWLFIFLTMLSLVFLSYLLFVVLKLL